MQGLMQERPLLISSLIEHANAFHPGSQIVSRTVEGPVHRCTYGDIHRRSKQVANALSALKATHAADTPQVARLIHFIETSERGIIR